MFEFPLQKPLHDLFAYNIRLTKSLFKSYNFKDMKYLFKLDSKFI